MTLSWAKRRRLDKPRQVKEVKLVDFKREKYSFCEMFVTFEDGEKVSLHGQILQNHIQRYWVVNGIDGKGNQVAVRLDDE